MSVFHTRQWLAEEGVPISLRASIGIASYPVDAVSPQALVQRADEMMYQVKQAGRDNIALTHVGIVGSEGGSSKS
jgi:diguanylate cyclase (GGDEF)-like protein